MPMFDANTNRVCTREAYGREDTPHMPVDQPKVATEFAADELCAGSHRDTPWVAMDPQSLSVGGAWLAAACRSLRQLAAAH